MSQPHLTPWRQKLHQIIFEADTPSGKLFDMALLVAIGLSVLAVLLDSVGSINQRWGESLRLLEWVLTILFSIEYLLRIVSLIRPVKYMTSFFGLVDLLSILPTYLSLVIGGTQSLLVIRALRLLRVFRVLKLVRFVGEAKVLQQSLKNSLRKIIIFLGAVLTVVIIMGAVMYIVEGPEHGFTSIPQSMYWAVVTMTTVGYGDIAPQTVLGKLLASLLMIMGYGIIAVPTGIVTAELTQSKKTVTTISCPGCTREDHDPDALHCKFCGTLLNPLSGS